MNPILKSLLSRLHAPAGDDGADTGGTDAGAAEDNAAQDDRGDDFTPTDGDADEAVGSGDEGQDDTSSADAASGADDGAGKEARHGAGIPKARFDEVNTRRKAVEAENERLRAELEEARKTKTSPPAAAPTAAPAAKAAETDEKFDPDAKEQEYIEALMAGETGQAAKIRREINQHLVAQASATAEATVTGREAKRLLDAEVSTTLATYPWLDTEEGADALDLISAARDRAISKGVPAHKALRDAVAKIAPRFAPEAAAGDPPAGVLPKGQGQGDTRTANAIKRGAEDSEAQPPVIQGGIGNRATAARVNVAQLDDKQFAELPEAEKRRLRGDIN